MSYRFGETIETSHWVYDSGNQGVTGKSLADFLTAGLGLYRAGAAAAESVSVTEIGWGGYRFRFTPTTPITDSFATYTLKEVDPAPGVGTFERDFQVFASGVAEPSNPPAEGDLTTRALVKEYATIGANVDAVVDRLVSAASEILKRLTSRRLVRSAYLSELYDGDSAGKRRTELWLREFPVNAVSSLKENGTLLSVGTGYSPTSDALLVGGEGYLLRGSGWASGRQNIEVSYDAGYDYPRIGASTDLPYDIEQAATELAVLLFNERNRIGEGGKSFEKWSVNYIRKLNPMIADVVSAYERGFRPC